ncbi:MAG TPA: DUF2950 family protein [Myxococcota bacterium]|nr:DUF2950 family protein [Myxococcota bacterium]
MRELALLALAAKPASVPPQTLFSRDLGANTAKIAGAVSRFDPDSTWKKED